MSQLSHFPPSQYFQKEYYLKHFLPSFLWQISPGDVASLVAGEVEIPEDTVLPLDVEENEEDEDPVPVVPTLAVLPGLLLDPLAVVSVPYDAVVPLGVVVPKEVDPPVPALVELADETVDSGLEDAVLPEDGVVPEEEPTVLPVLPVPEDAVVPTDVVPPEEVEPAVPVLIELPMVVVSVPEEAVLPDETVVP